MKTLIALSLAAALSGCSALVANAPTMQYCSKVNYVRDGNKITVSAECAAPIGGSIPVPGL